MRLKSELWVKAYLRRASLAGSPGVVARKGDADAGIILIKIARLDGTCDLYGPQPAGLGSDDGERRWVCVASHAAEAQIDARLVGETKLDPDAWIIEIEDRQGRHHLEGWLGSD